MGRYKIIVSAVTKELESKTVEFEMISDWETADLVRQSVALWLEHLGDEVWVSNMHPIKNNK